MSTLAFETVVEPTVFSELFGFVLLDPLTLEHFHGQSVLGTDLLSIYTKTDAGKKVSEVGAAIPVIGVEAGYYSLVVRDSAAPSLLTEPPKVASPGWVLNVTSGNVALCGIGYLANWNPQDKAVRCFPVPKGWYKVEVLYGESFNNHDFAIEFVLSSCSAKPAFTADVAKEFSEPLAYSTGA